MLLRNKRLKLHVVGSVHLPYLRYPLHQISTYIDVHVDKKCTKICKYI